MKMLDEYSLNYFDWKGFHPQKRRTRKAMVFLTVDIAVALMVTCSVFVDSVDIFAVADVFMVEIIIFNMIFKEILIFVCNTKFADLIDSQNRFGPKGDSKQKDVTAINRVMEVTRKVVLLIKYNIFAGFLAHIVAPFLSAGRKLPTPVVSFCEIEESMYCFVSLYAVDLIWCYILIHTLISFDGMYFIFIASGYCELQRVKDALLSLELDVEAAVDEESIMKDIALIVEQHNGALRFMQKVSNLYKYVLIYQILTSLFGACVSVFLATADALPKLPSVVKASTMAVGTLIQLVLYCTAGQLITEQCESVAETAYSIKWWNGRLSKVRKAICLIIQRSQRPIRITAGDVFELNMALLVSVLKTAGSALTFMQTISGKE